MIDNILRIFAKSLALSVNSQHAVTNVEGKATKQLNLANLIFKNLCFALIIS